MAIDIFETRTLIQSVNSIKPAPSFILDTFFANVQTSNTEAIDVEIYDGKRKLAPFVSPKVEGKLIESEGKTVHTYKPAYVKPKYYTEAADLVEKADGVFYADNKTPAQRAMDKYARELLEGRNSINRRIEVMATEAITTGQTTINGDGITDVVDYQMPSEHLKTLAGAALWTDSASDPMKDLRDWKIEVTNRSGVTPTHVVLGQEALDAFLANDNVQAYLDNRRITLGDVAPVDMGVGVTYWGIVEGLRMYSYSTTYTNDSNIEVDLFPAKNILIGSTMAQTVRAFGAIKDLDSGTFSGEIFAKSWTVEDPSGRMVLLQSAPLPIPTQISAFMCNQVVA